VTNRSSGLQILAAAIPSTTTFVNSTTLQIETPTHLPPGTYDVTVLNPDGTLYKAHNALTIGDAEQPIISLTPTSLDFKDVVVGSSKDLDITIENIGKSTLSGAVAATAPFSIINADPFDLQAGVSKNITVRFGPGSEGDFSSNLIIESNDAGSPHAVIVQGVGKLDPELKVVPGKLLNFGLVAIGDSVVLPLIVQNTGGGGIDVTCTVDTPFVLSDECSFSLAGGQSKSFEVRFDAVTKGKFSGTLQVTSSAGDVTVRLNAKVKRSNVSGNIRLFFSNDPDPNHPFSIVYNNIKPRNKRGQDFVIADVIVTNTTGAWYEVSLNFDTPTDGAIQSVSFKESKKRPYVFLIGPYGEKEFKKIIFYSGQYMHFNVAKTATRALAIYGLDGASRILLGLSLPPAIFDGTKTLALNLLKAIVNDCTPQLAAIGVELVLKNFSKMLQNTAEFIICTNSKAFKKQLLKLIRIVHGKKNAALFAGKLANFSVKALPILFNLPKLVALMTNEFDAKNDGYVRLEAR